MTKSSKRHAPQSPYSRANQLSLIGFETPFYNHLGLNNCWIVLSARIPWDVLVNLFNKHAPPKQTGRPALNPRILIGAVLTKRLLNLDDRETVVHLAENSACNTFWATAPTAKNRPLIHRCLWASINSG